MDAMVEALKPIIIFAMVLWGIETVVTMLIKDHKQAKRKRAREKRRLEYQDRRMANDAEHAKGHKGNALQRTSPRWFPLRPLRARPRGRREAPRRSYHPRIARWQVGDVQPPDPMRGLQLRQGKPLHGIAIDNNRQDERSSISNKAEALMLSTQGINSVVAKATQESYARSLVVSKLAI